MGRLQQGLLSKTKISQTELSMTKSVDSKRAVR